MKTLFFLVSVILAISSTSSRQHKRHVDSDEDDDLVHPPWWHPQSHGPGPGRGFDSFHRGERQDSFDPPSDHSGARWHPWDKRTSTERPRITYPIFPPNIITERTPDSGFSSARPNSNDLVLESCKAACRFTNEYKPVCGTDNLTYVNIGMLECARICGVDVQLKRKSSCSFTDPTLTPDNGGKNNGGGNGRPDNPLIIVACLRNCPVTSEYNPVCGSNNITYANPGRMECARNCGVDVSLIRRAACDAPIGPADATAACLLTCSVTSEYNPVCGTDNVTYPNPGRFECARNCGVAVEIMRRSPCSVPPGPNNPDIRGSTERPKGNGNWNGNRNPNGNGRPNANGNWNGNGNTNGNANSNGNGNWNGNGNPSGNGNWNGNGNPNGNGNWNGNGNPNGNGNWNINGNPNGNGNWNGNGNGNSNGNKNPSMTEIIACMQLCPITPEMNPVCGTDGVTYSNPGKLLCNQFCGVDVRVRQFAPCAGKPIPNLNPFACPTLPTPTAAFTNPPTIQDCIDKCTTPQELKPVCGTDGVTYINIESLQCKMNCGAAVSIRKYAPCGQTSTDQPTPQTPPVWGNTEGTTQPTVTKAPSSAMQMCINNCATSQEYSPVCGTDGVTYANLQRLLCAKQCGSNIAVQSMAPCFNTPSINGNKENSTEESGLGFTIPADILASVFPDINVPTQPSTTDSDESYELDIKFGETTKSQ